MLATHTFAAVCYLRLPFNRMCAFAVRAVSPDQMQSAGALVMLASHSFAGVHLLLAMHEQSGLVLWDVRCACMANCNLRCVCLCLCLCVCLYV